MEIDQAARAELIAAARLAAEQAYCPYSRFRIGAAVLTEIGRASCRERVFVHV
jgi:cytidine deaminase